jgi:hypothetical protein
MSRKKRPSMITNSNQVYFAKVLGREVQEVTSNGFGHMTTSYEVFWTNRRKDDAHDLCTISRLLKNAHLRRSPRPSSLRRTSKYASLLRISPACA